jgi:hypothetical protein
MSRSSGPSSAFHRYYDVTKARNIGYSDSADPVEEYRIEFDRILAVKIIP